MTVQLNSNQIDLPEGISISELIISEGLSEKKGIAVGINGSVVPKQQWQSHIINPNDSILIITATQGG